VAGLNSYATNAIATNATPLGNYLTKGASTQQVVIAPVQFNGTLRAGGGVALTNGFTRSVTNISPVTSNLVNYGNAIRSEGSGGNSLQVGSNAVASGALSMALGNGATASSNSSLAVGNSATASASSTVAIGIGSTASAAGATAAGDTAAASAGGAVAIGQEAAASAQSAIGVGLFSVASDNYTIAIGDNATASGFSANAIGQDAQATAVSSMAIGQTTTASHSNSLALGPPDHLGNAVATTTTNELRLGTANHVLSVPGFIRGTLSNLVTAAHQTNVLAGDLSTPIGAITTVANGANRLNMGTQSVVNITGSPTATWSIDGVIFGTQAPRDGHRLHIRNNSGYNATLAHNSGLEAVAGYRLSSPSGVDLILTNGAMAQLVYSAADSRWLVWSVFDGRLPGVGATNAVSSVWTNGVAVASSSATNLNIIYGSNMVFRATNINGQVDLHISSAAAGGGGGSSLVTNANQFGADTTLTIKSGALLTNLYIYGNSTNVGTIVNATSYHSNLVYRPISLVSPASTLTVDLAGGSMQTVTMTNNTTVAITNAAAGVNVSVLFIGPTNNQFNLIMPSGVRLFSGAITNAVTTNKSAIVSFTAYDSISTNVIATVAIEP
jgi:hypothetical protein